MTEQTNGYTPEPLEKLSWYDTVRCLTQELREQISEAVITAYRDK